MVVLPIPGHAGYFAAADGNIWSSHRGRWGNRYANPHRLKTKPDKDGYLCVTLVDAARRPTNCRVATLVARAFLGPRPKGLVVCHRNGMNTDNRHENLMYGTQLENIRQAVEQGRMTCGARSHLAKLTDEQALEILRRIRAGESQAALAREFEVTDGTVSALKTGRTWRHLAAES